MQTEPMTIDELVALHQFMSAKALDLLKKKNSDYTSAKGVPHDPFRNFRRHGPYGILVRLSDKLARMESFEAKGSYEVADEKLIDTCLDSINYPILFYALTKELEGEKKKATAPGALNPYARGLSRLKATAPVALNYYARGLDRLSDPDV